MELWNPNIVQIAETTKITIRSSNSSQVYSISHSAFLHIVRDIIEFSKAILSESVLYFQKCLIVQDSSGFD